MSYYPNDGQGYNQQNSKSPFDSLTNLVGKSMSQPNYGGGGYGGKQGDLPHP